MRPIELIVETQLYELCDTSGTSVSGAYSISILTELHITTRSAVKTDIAYLGHQIKLEHATIRT